MPQCLLVAAMSRYVRIFMAARNQFGLTAKLVTLCITLLITPGAALFFVSIEIEEGTRALLRQQNLTEQQRALVERQRIWLSEQRAESRDQSRLVDDIFLLSQSQQVNAAKQRELMDRRGGGSIGILRCR